MAKVRLKSPRARLFVALELPTALRTDIVQWGREELCDKSLRPVAPDSLHITLAFLGYLPEREIEDLREIIAAAAAPAPQIELRDPVPRPRNRPRLFALPAVSPESITLQRVLRERLVAAHLYKPEERPFWPHVTVARVRRERRGSKRPALVSRPPGPLPGALLHATKCVRMTLYRSELRPQGAEYTRLAQVELPKAGRQ